LLAKLFLKVYPNHFYEAIVPINIAFWYKKPRACMAKLAELSLKQKYEFLKKGFL
jgi:hypothetical protein